MNAGFLWLKYTSCTLCRLPCDTYKFLARGIAFARIPSAVRCMKFCIIALLDNSHFRVRVILLYNFYTNPPPLTVYSRDEIYGLYNFMIRN